MYESSDIEAVQAYVDASYRFYERYYRLEEEFVGADYVELIGNKDAVRGELLLESEDTYEVLELKFHRYMVGVLEYYLTIFKDEAFEGEMEALPPEACAAVWLNEFFCRDELDWEGRIYALKEAGKACVSLGEKVKIFAKLLGEKRLQIEQEKITQAKQAGEQLNQMIEIMKGKIRQMIEDGQKVEAIAVLAQVRALAPEDQELIQMEVQLQNR